MAPSLYVPNMWVADDADMSFSLDGAVLWVDLVQAGSVISTDAIPPISSFVLTSAGALFGTNDGRLILVAGGVPIVLLTGLGSPVVHCWYDKLDFDVAWFVTKDGRLYRNNSAGQSGFNWFLWDNLRIVFDAPTYEASRIATPLSGGIWVYGGRGGPLVAIDPLKNHGWIQPKYGGDLVTDIVSSTVFSTEVPTAPAPVLVGVIPRELIQTLYWDGVATAGVEQPMYSGDAPMLPAFTGRDLWCFPDGLRMLCIVDAYIDDTGVSQGVNGPGYLALTQNGGAFWRVARPSAPLGDIDASPDPVFYYETPQISAPSQIRLYGARKYAVGSDGSIFLATDLQNQASPFSAIEDGDGTAHPTRLWKSTDGGAVFELVYTLPSFSSGGHTNWPFKIESMAISADAQTIMASLSNHQSSAHGEADLAVSTDGGTTWTMVTTGSAAFVNGPGQLTAAAAGRFIWYASGSPTKQKPAYSDNTGATWTAATITYGGTVFNDYGAVSRWHGGAVHLMGAWNYAANPGTIVIYISTNSGATWTILAALTAALKFRVGTAFCNAFDYDPVADRLFVSTDDDGADASLANQMVVNTVTGALSFSTRRAQFDSAINFLPSMFGQLNSAMWAPHLNAVIGGGQAKVHDAASREFGELAIILDGDNVPAVYYTANINGDGSDWKRALGAPIKSHGRWIAPDYLPGQFLMGFDDNVTYKGDVTSGVLSMSESAAALPGGEVQNHGVWVGGITGLGSGVYVVAAEAGIYKTWTRGDSWSPLRGAGALNAMPAGGHAKMIALSLPIPGQVGNGNGSGAAPPAPTAPSRPPVPVPGSRNPVLWPFATSSPWNTPIGSGALFIPAGLTAEPNMTVDVEYFVRPAEGDPVQTFYENGVFGVGRCVQTVAAFSMQFPDALVIPDADGGTPNNCAAILDPNDARTLKQVNPLSRCIAAGAVTFGFSTVDSDLYGDGIRGSHGGSGLSSLGGSLRLGELTDADPIRHAIKLNVRGKTFLSPTNGGYRWPAAHADDYYNNGGDPNHYTGTVLACRMGSLLAIPSSVDINALVLHSVPARKLAWTLQNYGAYIPDDTAWAAYALCCEDGVDAEVNSAFGFSLYANSGDVGAEGNWYADIMALIELLQVVNNNASNNVGGGGTPLQPLAPEL